MPSTEPEAQVELFHTQRPCSGEFDTSQLALQSVDNAVRHYSNKLIRLYNSDIVRVSNPKKLKKSDPAYFWSVTKGHYSLALAFRYRMEWQPKGYGLGELIYSVSLLPNEELTLEVKTWETEKHHKSYEETKNVQKVTDLKVDKSDAREVLDDYSQKQHFEVDAHASAKWGWGSASVNSAYSYDAAEHHKNVAKRSRQVVSKVVNDVASKRAVKMTVSRETGSEDKTTRKIKNINQCHTLNVNYYQLLQQFRVGMYVDDVSLILLGRGDFSPAPGSAVIGGGIPQWTPTRDEMVEQLSKLPLDDDPKRFQYMVLKHAELAPELCHTDQDGTAVFAYEVKPGFDAKGNPAGLNALLEYLFGFWTPNSPPAPMEPQTLIAGWDRTISATGGMIIDRSHFLSGVRKADVSQEVAKAKQTLVEEFGKVHGQIGTKLDEWAECIPTMGIYAETMLGKCSGCEDFFEIQRQFDLESKRLEVEKLKLELEKLAILNQQVQKGPPAGNVNLTNLPDSASVAVNLDVKPSTDTATSVNFEEKKP